MRTTVWLEQSLLTQKYCVRWYDPITGKKQRFACASYRDALQKQSEMRLRLMNTRYGKPTDDNPLVLIHAYLASMQHTHRPRSIKCRRYPLEMFFKPFFKMSDITSAHIQTYKQKLLGDGFSSSTVNIRLTYIKAFLNWCVRQHHIEQSPYTKEITLPPIKQRGRWLCEKDIKNILANIPVPYRLYYQILAETGARRGEVSEMEWKDLSPSYQLWTIPAEKCKTKKARIIPLSKNVSEELKRMPQKGYLVFKNFGYEQSRNIFKTAAKQAGILDRVTLHDLRHSFASAWTGRAATLRAVMGWTSPVMMLRYQHTDLQHTTEELRQNAWGKFGGNDA